MPMDIQKKIHNGAMEVLSDSGVEVEQFKDETGQTFLRLNGIERLGIPDDEMDRMHAMAGELPVPVGSLSRVH